MAMNQDERRLAMLRQRGELPDEESSEQKKQDDVQKRSHSSRFGSSKKKRAGKNTYLNRKEMIRKRQLRQKRIRLALYAGALVVVVLVLITLIRSCTKKDPTVSDTKSQAETSSEGGNLLQTPGEGDKQTDKPFGENGDTQESSTEDVIPVAAGVSGKGVDISGIQIPNWITQDFLPVNPVSRPQIYLDEIRYIAIHYVANPNTSAKNNRNYFEHLGDPNDPAYNQRKASAQLIVGLQGEVLQCMPLNEMAYAVRDEYNPYTISIEVCHPDSSGKFSATTYDTVVKLAAWLMQQFDLDETALLRHYDCDGKSCPKYYVEHEDAWKQLKADIIYYSKNHPDIS